MKRVRSKRVKTLLAMTGITLLVSSCGGQKNLITQENVQKEPVTGESWTVMVYMVGGSDEHLYGTASKALKDMTKVSYPENLNVVIETGGTFKWNVQGIDTNYFDRLEAQNDNLKLVERREADDMSKNLVLTNFIDWCEENYSADHYALIVYGSGANSAYGTGHDETADNRSLSLPVLSQAIENASMHFDIIGFDADLMASAEAASLLSTSADYLVASQEIMAEGGWNYSDWFQYMIENPTSSVADVAKAACDTYMDKCDDDNTDEMATMSVTQLSAITNLSQAIEGMAGELRASSEALNDYSVVSKAVDKVMCFGANAPEEGYSNMIDINDLAVRSGSITDKTSGRVQEELENSVIYRANGKYRHEASGLSIYYPLSQSSEELPKYLDMCPFKRYSEFIAETTANADHGSSVDVSFADTTAFSDYEIERDRMQHKTVPGSTGLELNMLGNMDIVREINQRIFMKTDNGYVYLGDSAEIDSSWDAGIFKTKNNFSFPKINGHNISLNLVYSGDGYSIYSVPLKIDGEQKNLRIAAVKKSNGNISYKKIGLYNPLGTNKKASRHITPVRIYNLLTPLYRDYSAGELVEGASFKPWPFGMHISDKALDNGSYKTDYRIEYIYDNDLATNAADFEYNENRISYK